MKKDKSSPFIRAYLRLLQLASAVEKLPGMESFDANEKALFEEIMLAWSKHTPLTVRRAIEIERLGSPATLHKRIIRLREMALVDAIYKEGDRKTKFLIPTEKGLQYVGSLGRAYSQSLQTDA